MQHRISNRQSAHQRFGKSVRFLNPGSDTYSAFRFGIHTFVKAVWLKIDTAYSALSTGQLSVGYVDGSTTDNDGFIDVVGADALTTGMKLSTSGSAAAAAGYFFNNHGGLLTITFDKGNATTDVDVYVFVDYTFIS
jgi:hypothetical protein